MVTEREREANPSLYISQSPRRARSTFRLRCGNSILLLRVRPNSRSLPIRSFQVDTLGGHSSVPPAHTSIGILSLLLATLEANPFPAKFKPTNPYLQMLQCAADFGPDMDDSLKSRLKDSRKWDDLADELSQDRIVRAFLGTTIAIDIVSGGVKVNALPETAKATVNHRIDFTSSVNETLEYVLDVLEPVVRKLNLTLSHPGHESVQAVDVVRLDFGKRFVDSPGFGLEPAPLTPTHGKAFELVAGTTRKVFADAIVAPSGMIANTGASSSSFSSRTSSEGLSR